MCKELLWGPVSGWGFFHASREMEVLMCLAPWYWLFQLHFESWAVVLFWLPLHELPCNRTIFFFANGFVQFLLVALERED
ncbi:uncharacterized protein J3R85_010459 [Psidium guajava]|nr:uncharacterized protein J3R85_010459 [Psidium guajava]